MRRDLLSRLAACRDIDNRVRPEHGKRKVLLVDVVKRELERLRLLQQHGVYGLPVVLHPLADALLLLEIRGVESQVLRIPDVPLPGELPADAVVNIQQNIAAVNASLRCIHFSPPFF